MKSELSTAIITPCYNESVAIESVIKSFQEHLPTAQTYVYNNSTDGTPEIAKRNGAIIRNEPQQGKGQVVRRMFSDIEASVYVLVDGDTHDAASAPTLIKSLVNNHCDMCDYALWTGYVNFSK